MGRFIGLIICISLTFTAISCGIDDAVKQGIGDAGKNAANVVMDRMPEVTPAIRDAISESVVAGVDRVMQKFNLPPQSSQSNGWLSSVISSIGFILIYILGHRFPWIRMMIDGLKGTGNCQSNGMKSSTSSSVR